jgi:hypothetical protein
MERIQLARRLRGTSSPLVSLFDGERREINEEIYSTNVVDDSIIFVGSNAQFESINNLSYINLEEESSRSMEAERTEIDLTVSSSEDDELLAHQGARNCRNSRKRRRSCTNNDIEDRKTIFNTSSAESTSVSLSNNDVIEQFKRSLKCSICLDIIQDMTSTICGHVYCGKCIRAAIRATSKCPLCQRKIRLKDIHGLFF